MKYSAEDIAKADPGVFLPEINRDTLIDTHDQSATSTAAEEEEDILRQRGGEKKQGCAAPTHCVLKRC